MADKFTPYTVIPNFFTATNLAKEKSKEYYPTDSQWQGAPDAYRHVAWQAMLAKKYGPTLANLAGQWHELPLTALVGAGAPNQTDLEKEQDLFNNEIGRKIAERATSVDEILQMAKEAVDNKEAKYLSNEEIKKLKKEDPYY